MRHRVHGGVVGLRRRAGIIALIGLGGLGIPLAPAALAEGTSKGHQARFERMKADLASHKADEGALKEDLKAATGLYTDAEGQDELRGQIVDLVGRLAKATRNEVVATAALHALGDMGDLRGARYVKPFLKQPNPKKAPPLLEIAIAVAGEVPDASLVEPLLKLVERSRKLAIAGAAMESLGKFSKCRKKRVKILERLVRTTQKDKPGGRPGRRGGSSGMDDGSGYSDTGTGFVGQEGGPTARWNTLTAALPGALSELTGTDVSRAEDWFILYKENKRNLRSLFSDED